VLDFPASADALWSLFDEGGPRPEYVLPVLYAESGFDPSTPNRQGAPYYGINQASVDLISQHAGVTPGVYLTWPASKQIATVVRGYMLALVAAHGPLRSATRVEQANYLPATLEKARGLSSVVVLFGDPYYNAGLDVGGKGYVTVQDLAHFVGPHGTAKSKEAWHANVEGAIARTYAERPSETPREPVYGEDFGRGAGPVVLGLGAALLAYAWWVK
jgi:hypothetical protein